MTRWGSGLDFRKNFKKSEKIISPGTEGGVEYQNKNESGKREAIRSVRSISQRTSNKRPIIFVNF